jgi:hypothetical protein
MFINRANAEDQGNGGAFLASGRVGDVRKRMTVKI